MFRNYLKVALRNLWRKKIFSFINIFGLALGLSFCGLIGIYVYDGWRVDRFQPANLYRVITSYTSKNLDSKLETVGRALVPSIEKEVPEVEYVIPLRRSRYNITVNNEHYFDKLAYAGEHFLEAFSFPLLSGDAATALQQPYSAVLTETMALKYFGTKEIVGRTLYISDTIPCKVTAVLKDLPPSHMDFDVLLSFATFLTLKGTMEPWFTWDMTCYVKLKEKTDHVLAAKKISALSMQHNGEEYRKDGYDVRQELEPVRDIYLHSTLTGFNKAAGSARQLTVFTIIGIALLILACINFINLTTAHQVERAKEVGVRKTIGASSPSLVVQFLLETGMMVILAAATALAFIVVGLPHLARLAEIKLSLSLLTEPIVIGAAILLVVLTTVLAGWYPSFLLSRLRPVESIRRLQKYKRAGFSLRQVLVVIQFSISLILIIGTLIATDQLRFMQNEHLGFNKQHVLIINLRNTPDKSFDYESLKQQLLQINHVATVAGASALPGRTAWGGQIVLPEGFPRDQTVTMEVIPIDHDYVKTLGIRIIKGRDFSKAFSTDANHGVLLNETACRLIGWKPEEAVGKLIQTPGMDSGRVVGVMQDYHQHGLQHAIGPILAFIFPNGLAYIAVKVDGKGLNKTINTIETFWKSQFPGYPFDYFMLDDDFDMQYKAEKNLAKVIGLFSLLTILVACLGLFGLTAFIVIQRTKEIGIRKVLGATIMQIVALLCRDFIVMVIIAILISSPIAWWIMSRWLQDFAYRVPIQWWVFGVAGTMAVLVALMTISLQSIRAALMNPVKSLRTE